MLTTDCMVADLADDKKGGGGMGDMSF